MTEKKHTSFFTSLIVGIGVLFAAAFTNKKLKEHGLRLPTFGDYIQFLIGGSIIAIGCIILWCIGFFIFRIIMAIIALIHLIF